MNTNLSYYERYWKSQEVLSDFTYKWPKIKHLIPTDKKTKLLDFGCGKGTILGEILKVNPSIQATGVDVSQKALDFAKKKYPKTTFVKINDGGRLPFPDNSFDFITALDVLEHVYDTEATFTELARVLKPNGKILISVPYNGLIKNLFITLFFFDYIFDPATPHIRFYTKKSMSKYLMKSNLVPKYWNYHGRFYPLSSGMHVLAQKLPGKLK